jgi:pimeloyl-ACP methyl ester carboxylesterase
MPRTSVRIAEELRTALHHASFGGPYILVGSAFGGDNLRTFADLYMDEVAGLVLDDADPTDVEPTSMREEEHRGHAGIPSDLRDCRNAIVVTQLPNTSRCQRKIQVLASHDRPVLSRSSFGVCRKPSGLRS